MLRTTLAARLLPLGLAFAAGSLAACSDDSTGTPTNVDAGATLDGGAVADGTDAASSPDAAGGEDTEPAPDPLSMPDWCQASNQIWCEWMFECFNDADLTEARRTFGFSNSVESCAEVAVASCQNRTIPAVNEGRQTFDGVQAARCVDALRDEACGTFEDLFTGAVLNPPPCDTVSTGQITQGQPCVSSNDCAAEDARCTEEGYCTGRLDRTSFLGTCDPADVLSVAACPGLQCLRVQQGAGQVGVCTHACTLDEHCGEGGGCFVDNSGDRFCLALCDDDDDCGGFSCVQAGPDRTACMLQ